MKMIKLNAIDSTNSYLKKLLTKENLDDLTVVMSKNQTKGKGRNGNIWENEPNLNLAFSIYKRFKSLSVNERFMLNVLSSVSVYELLKKYNLFNLSIKWPNDIMSENKKISGILIENSFRGNKINHTIIGIGININQSVFKNLPNATSIFLEKGVKYSVEQIADELLEVFKKNFIYFEQNENKLFDFYKSVLFRQNINSNFITPELNEFKGKIISVNKKGVLTIKQKNQQNLEYKEDEIKMKI